MVWIRKAFSCVLLSFQSLGAPMSGENEGLYGVDPKKV